MRKCSTWQNTCRRTHPLHWAATIAAFWISFFKYFVYSLYTHLKMVHSSVVCVCVCVCVCQPFRNEHLKFKMSTMLTKIITNTEMYYFACISLKINASIKIMNLNKVYVSCHVTNFCMSHFEERDIKLYLKLGCI
jgi:hypothetical protein